MAFRTDCASSGSTLGESFTTRDTVARETPASAATISSVGTGRGPPARCVMIISGALGGWAGINARRPWTGPPACGPRRRR